MDKFGDHWAACNRSGRLGRRAGPLEVAIRRVLQEAMVEIIEGGDMDRVLADVQQAANRTIQ